MRLRQTTKFILVSYPRIFWEFFIFSFMGFILETGFVFVVTGEWTVRGVLAYGIPIIHIYGFGALIIVHVAGIVKHKPVLYFVVSMILLSAIELAASYFENIVTGVRTWDYSDKPFNFQGRICLSTTLGWGALAFLVEYVIYPEVTRIINKIPKKVLVYTSVFLGAYLVIITILKYFIR